MINKWRERKEGGRKEEEEGEGVRRENRRRGKVL